MLLSHNRLSLEEVDEMYRSGVKPWNSATWKPQLHAKFEEEYAKTHPDHHVHHDSVDEKKVEPEA